MKLSLTIGAHTFSVALSHTRCPQAGDTPVDSEPPHVVDGPLTETQLSDEDERHELNARERHNLEGFEEDTFPRVPGLVINPQPALRLNRDMGEALRNMHAALSEPRVTTKPPRVTRDQITQPLAHVTVARDGTVTSTHEQMRNAAENLERMGVQRVIVSDEQTRANLRWTAERSAAARADIARRTGRTIGY